MLALVVNFFSFKVRSLNATCKYRSVRMKRTKTTKKSTVLKRKVEILTETLSCEVSRWGRDGDGRRFVGFGRAFLIGICEERGTHTSTSSWTEVPSRPTEVLGSQTGGIHGPVWIAGKRPHKMRHVRNGFNGLHDERSRRVYSLFSFEPHYSLPVQDRSRVLGEKGTPFYPWIVQNAIWPCINTLCLYLNGLPRWV